MGHVSILLRYLVKLQIGEEIWSGDETFPDNVLFLVTGYKFPFRDFTLEKGKNKKKMYTLFIIWKIYFVIYRVIYRGAMVYSGENFGDNLGEIQVCISTVHCWELHGFRVLKRVGKFCSVLRS